jgi:hypothetical protein
MFAASATVNGKSLRLAGAGPLCSIGELKRGLVIASSLRRFFPSGPPSCVALTPVLAAAASTRLGANTPVNVSSRPEVSLSRS